MTRDFNNQPRDDERPSSRDASSGRDGEERSPHPARPRLNRETVDRAWESGAPPKHADYRARNNNRPASRDNWRRDQPAGSPSAQSSRNTRRPFDRDNQRQPARPPYGNADSRPRPPYNGGSRNFNDQRNNDRRNYSERPPRNNSYENSTPRNYAPRPHYGNRPQGQQGGYQPRPHNSDRPQEQRGGPQPRPPYSGGDRPQEQRGGYQPRGFDRDRPQGQQGGYQPRPHNSDRPQEQRGSYQPRDRDERRPARNFDERPPRNFERNQQGPRGYQQQQNPRWQSRPSTQRDYAPRRYEAPRPAPQPEQFEGDYERFNAPDAPQSPVRPVHQAPGYPDRQQHQDGTDREQQPVERHVTRLPNGRVLKGPRPVQRKNAQFWTEVAQETDALVAPLETSAEPEALVAPLETSAESEALVAPLETSAESEVTDTQITEAESPSPTQEGEAAPLTKVQRKALAKPHTASAVARGKKVGTKKKAGTKVEKPRSTGPKPSQRGYKWPTT